MNACLWRSSETMQKQVCVQYKKDYAVTDVYAAVEWWLDLMRLEERCMIMCKCVCLTCTHNGYVQVYNIVVIYHKPGHVWTPGRWLHLKVFLTWDGTFQFFCIQGHNEVTYCNSPTTTTSACAYPEATHCFFQKAKTMRSDSEHRTLNREWISSDS